MHSDDIECFYKGKFRSKEGLSKENGHIQNYSEGYGVAAGVRDKISKGAHASSLDTG
ncbi:hypothetical protein RND71_011440 [Anisodus tanguticus]|uniref:Uncharacterized protein n=1 Tax=Anisodus tanguticus TaxID=243964 RepID=A0AAE1SBI4_9SOLA|nr:hypothetical protein RND71_011440 [Anisodus tanguticus]